MLFYPSEQEGFGLAGIEAASFGVPFLGLAGTVTCELFPDGNGVVPLLTDSRLPSRLGDAARKRVQSTFLEEHFAARFCQALRGVLPNLFG